MSAFSTSGRKEDVSLKLRAQNMKKAKEMMKKMEQENHQMEERLRDLKIAMNREKEERERQGGGFWQRGYSGGTLNNYATELLLDNTVKSGKIKGVKVLKDEPLDLPRRHSGPGTLKYIAQGSSKANQGQDSRNKSIRCGQCENRQASLNCVQCSEHYCAGCFAAFHLKGALKRHRSIPLHASGPRQRMSPRPTPPGSSRSSMAGGETSGDVLFQPPSSGHGGASGSTIEGSVASVANPLMDGEYSEASSDASFQQALKAWREGDSTLNTATEERSNVVHKSPTRPQQVVITSPVTPVRMVDHSTSTNADLRKMPVPNIKSAPSSLSYAQRLMLKQHRRSELPSLPSSRVSNVVTPLSGSSGLTCLTPQFSSAGGRKEVEGASDQEEVDMEDEHVDFQTLYEAMAIYSDQSSSQVTVAGPVHMDRVVDSAGSDEFTVQESSGDLDLDSQSNKTSGMEEAVSSLLLSKSKETTQDLKKQAHKTKCRTVGKDVDNSWDWYYNEVLLNMNQSHTSSTDQHTQVPTVQVQTHRGPLAELSAVQKREKTVVNEKPPPSSSSSLSSSVPRPKSRPTPVRVQSTRSRPVSRAHSRAVSRMKIEGVLTKAPSSALSEIANRATDTTSQYSSPMEGFFLAGVKVEDQGTGSRSQPVTPVQGAESKSRPAIPAHMEKLRVSSKLYAMSPRSWRPDSSLGGSLPAQSLNGVGGVGDVPQVPTPVMHYTYSGQLQGQAFSWNPQDSLSIAISPEADYPTTPIPTQDDRSATPITPTPRTGQQRRGRITPDPNCRPFSAEQNCLSNGQRQERKPLRPSSSTGGAEPSKKQRRQLPPIDRDLDGDQRERARLQNMAGNDGWIAYDKEQGPAIPALSASRTHSWVASQNSQRLGSGQWQTEVQDFVSESSGFEERLEAVLRTQNQQNTARSLAHSDGSSNNKEECGRLSRLIMMDGDDLSKYDTDCGADRVEQNTDDINTLHRLEWELASESGRLTAEGHISRLSSTDMEDFSSSGSRSTPSLRLSFDQGYDIGTKLREDEMSEGDNEQRSHSCIGMTDEQEVRALK